MVSYRSNQLKMNDDESVKPGEIQFDAHWLAEPRLSGSGFPAIS